MPGLGDALGSVAPDLSSLSARVSDTVSTAILSGTKLRLSSRPGIQQGLIVFAGRA
jgi:hypothetical protein